MGHRGSIAAPAARPPAALVLASELFYAAPSPSRTRGGGAVHRGPGSAGRANCVDGFLICDLQRARLMHIESTTMCTPHKLQPGFTFANLRLFWLVRYMG